MPPVCRRTRCKSSTPQPLPTVASHRCLRTQTARQATLGTQKQSLELAQVASKDSADTPSRRRHIGETTHRTTAVWAPRAFSPHPRGHHEQIVPTTTPCCKRCGSADADPRGVVVLDVGAVRVVDHALGNEIRGVFDLGLRQCDEHFLAPVVDPLDSASRD